MDDGVLLAAFVAENSQEAFHELIRRHVGMVYAVCRRQLRDAHWAEDVTQVVFILLARKAATLPKNVVLGGWLYKAAVYACSNARDLERTRTYHENLVTLMRKPNTNEDAIERMEIEGLLDEGLMELNRAQREVLVLRYFENKPLTEVARARRQSLYATQKTLDAGLARLRRFLSQRGVAATAAIVVAALGVESSRAVPPTLAASVENAALGHALPEYVSQLATRLIKQAARVKFALVVAVAGIILMFAMGTIWAVRPEHARVDAGAMSSLAQTTPFIPEPTQEIDALWRTLRGANDALRNMNMASLNQVVAFTDTRQAQDWQLMASVFASNQTLIEAAINKYGPMGKSLTPIQTFGTRLDQVLPKIDRDNLHWKIDGDSAKLHFTYYGDQARGGTIYFAKIDGLWRIDVGQSFEVALEGLDNNSLRMEVQGLPEPDRALVLDKVDAMGKALRETAANIGEDPTYNFDRAEHDLQVADARAPGRAFFRLALRFDNEEQVRE
ncbi:MAG TPA: sigma-70 family RNA polymerase sigma factor [Phycisphaerae bacterium]|nr:sigma-70 family RNA polymerase sigma factor [Phycisphaerae bacterium]